MNESGSREIKITIPEEIFAFFVPGNAHRHLLNARKEVLLALRSLIDARIEALEKKEENKAARKKKIKIE